MVTSRYQRYSESPPAPSGPRLEQSLQQPQEVDVEITPDRCFVDRRVEIHENPWTQSVEGTGAAVGNPDRQRLSTSMDSAADTLISYPVPRLANSGGYRLDMEHGPIAWPHYYLTASIRDSTRRPILKSAHCITDRASAGARLQPGLRNRPVLSSVRDFNDSLRKVIN